MGEVTTKPTRVENPFGTATPAIRGAAAQGLATREAAETIALFHGARANPRDPARAMDHIITAFGRPELAESATYVYSRGGTEITGPSIRAAEALRLEWGNLSSGWRVVSTNPGLDGVNVSEVEAWAIDYETGCRESAQWAVRHWRDTKSGGYALKDDRDVYELLANQASRRRRACILALIPADVVETAMRQAHETMRATADVTPEQISKLVKAFAEFGVTRDMLAKKIQRPVESIAPAQLVQMKKHYAALRDGIANAAEIFGGAAPGADESESVGAMLKTTRKRATPPPAPEPEPEAHTPPPPTSTDPETGEITDAPTT